MKKNPVTLISYGIAGLFGLAVSVFLWIRRGLFTASFARSFGVLSDGFTVAGALLLLAGLCCLLYRPGFFKSGAEAFRKLFDFRRKNSRLENREPPAEEEEEKEPPMKRFGFLFVTGLVFLALAGIFLLLYFIFL